MARADDAASLAPHLIWAGVACFMAAALAFTAIFPPVYNGSKASVTCAGGGACYVRDSSNGRATLRTQTAPFGFNVTEDGDNVEYREVGFQSDADRLSLFSSTNLMRYDIGAATYRTSYMLSTAGTPLYHGIYQLYIYVLPNATGVTTALFTLPDEFTSPPTPDGTTVLNFYGVFAADCNGINNDDGTPLDIAAYINTAEQVYIGYPGPTLFMRAVYATAGTGGMGITCNIDVIAPLP